jgi:hypothetical protein
MRSRSWRTIDPVHFLALLGRNGLQGPEVATVAGGGEPDAVPDGPGEVEGELGAAAGGRDDRHDDAVDVFLAR